jgi:phage terminase small subunit
MPGRPRKPTELHLIQGTAQKCRMEAQGRGLEPQVNQGMPDAPDWLPAGAAQEWGFRVATTPWLRATDEPMFLAYCIQRDQIVRAVREGRDVSPAAWAAYRSACQSFGFTPADRARMQMPATEQKPANKFAKLGAKLG